MKHVVVEFFFISPADFSARMVVEYFITSLRTRGKSCLLGGCLTGIILEIMFIFDHQFVILSYCT